MNAETIEFLLHGYTFYSETHIDPAEGRCLWADHGAGLLDGWIQRFPMTRPWGWWLVQIVNTGPRRQLQPGPRALGPPIWFGIPARWDGVPPAGMFENEAEYIRRHGLAGEQELRLSAVTGVAVSTMEK